jgi:predicted dehydrogenase
MSLMTGEVTIALVAINGYGQGYLNEVLDKAAGKNVRLVAVVDPMADRCERLPELQAQGVPVYASLEDFYAESTADLVVISTPIQLHVPMAKLALAHGSNVLCEKPLAATVQEGLELAEAEDQAAGFVAIGYQWSFSQAVQEMKRDILAGEFGRPKQLKTMVLAPRNAGYYGRNNWAGALKSADGRWVLDSPVNNATAHHLHNMFYLLGQTRETSACPVQVRAELYRANPIANYDTAALRCRTEEGVDVLFYTSHAVPAGLGPVGIYEFEKASISLEGWQGRCVARYYDGRTKLYGQLDNCHGNKLWQCVDAVRTGQPVPCGVRTALSHTLCMNGAQDSSAGIGNFPEELIQTTGDGTEQLRWVTGLSDAVVQCFAQGILPSEHGGLTWALPGSLVDLRGYREFQG